MPETPLKPASPIRPFVGSLRGTSTDGAGLAVVMLGSREPMRWPGHCLPFSASLDAGCLDFVGKSRKNDLRQQQVCLAHETWVRRRASLPVALGKAWGDQLAWNGSVSISVSIIVGWGGAENSKWGQA